MKPHLFVDGTNVDRRLEAVFGYGMSKVDAAKFLTKVADVPLNEINYYTATFLTEGGATRYAEQQGVLHRLRRHKVNVILGRHETRTRTCEICQSTHLQMVEKQTDIALAVGMARAAFSEGANCITLLTNDTDMVPAVSLCKELGVKLRIAFVEESGRAAKAVLALTDLADELVPINAGFMADCRRP